MTGTGNHAWQEQRRQQLAQDRYGGICECGNHAWARLTKGFVILVEPGDAFRIQNQSYTAQFSRGAIYAAHVVTIEGKKRTHLLHRETLNTARDQETDFKNGNTLDCRNENLRRCARSEIIQRQSGKKSSRTEFRGVRHHQNRWYAKLKYLGKTIYLGSFPLTTEGEVAAAQAYDDGARRLFGKFAVFNFPRDDERSHCKPDAKIEQSASCEIAASRSRS